MLHFVSLMLAASPGKPADALLPGGHVAAAQRGPAGAQASAPAGLNFFEAHYYVRECSAMFDDLTPQCPRHTSDGYEYRILGYEPAGPGPHPVYIFTSGGYPSIPFYGVSPDMPEMVMLQNMASRGFIAAVAELPKPPSVAFNCEAGSNESLPAYSQSVYEWRGPGYTKMSTKSLLATLCRLPNADCALGIAIHGHSIGGQLANLAPRFAVGVTALLLWGAGSRIPYGDLNCCGMFSGGRSCCEAGAPIAGATLPCQRYEETSSRLDRSRRRLVIAHHDHEYGDCFLRIANGAPRCNASSANNPAGALWIARHDSGYDCGEETTCLTSDGAGYILPRQVGDNVTNPHNFHNVPDPAAVGDPDLTERYILNPIWLRDDSPWGMNADYDWISVTARRPRVEAAQPPSV